MSQFENNKKKIFAEQLRNIMKEYGKKHGARITQEDLAEVVGVARETISFWLRAKSYPGAEYIKKLSKFFVVPPQYFEGIEEGQTLVDERIHKALEDEAEKTARKIGLSSGLVTFIKENPTLADAVVAASWVDAGLQSFSPNVPELPENTFQIKASSGVKIYPPDEVLYMLRVVQRDLEEYALFLIQKWSKIIQEAMDDRKARGVLYDGVDAAGNEFVSAKQRYHLELKGQSSLTPGSSLLADMYKLVDPKGQQAMIKAAQSVAHEYRKKDPKAQKVRKAVRSVMGTDKPVPPIEEILKED